MPYDKKGWIAIIKDMLNTLNWFYIRLLDQKEKGVPLKAIQDLLGHASIKTTEGYLHLSNKFRGEIRSLLDDLDI